MVLELEKELGKKQKLSVVKKVDFGVYLGNEEERVLLPKKQVPEGTETGDLIEVFLYKDSDDRVIATTKEPKLKMDEVKVLTVIETSKIGAFLDWGLDKDLLLPFKEQTGKIMKGDACLVSLYIDKSRRLCATMKVYDKLLKDSPYKKDDWVSGIIYDTSDEFGLFVAVDDRYSALLPKKEVFKELKVGDSIKARVTGVKEDGKLDLSIREKAFIQMDADAKFILDHIEANGGELPFTDKADPEIIKQKLGMSKNAFKRGIGRLLKEGRIEIREKSIAIRME